MSERPTLADSTIERVLLKLKTATKPVTEILHQNEGFKATIVGLNPGVLLPDHTTKVPAKLTVLMGSVVYQDAAGVIPLFCFDELEIPVSEVHSVRANRRSICLLTRG